MKRKQFSIFLSLFLLLASLPKISFSQSPFFEEIPFNYQNSAVKVSRILKDKDGWLFFGTDKGLFRYDGINFNKIICRDTLKEETVSALFQSGNGQLWVGFHNGSIARYTNKKFSLFKPEEGLPKVSITGFEETKNGTIWIGTNGEGVYCISKNHLYNFNMDDGLNDNFVHDIHKAGNPNSILAASDQGLNECIFTEGQKSVSNISPGEGFPDNIITSLMESGQKLVAGTQDKGICIVDSDRLKIMIPEISRNWQFGMVNKIISVEEDLWMATDENGLVIADASGKLRLNVKNTAFFPHNKINDLATDNEGNVWIACNDGLVKSPGNKMQFMETMLKEKIAFIHTILFDSKGNCWLTPDQGLLKIWKDTIGIFHTQKFTITPPDKLVDIVTLYEDPFGSLWIGTMGAGVFRLDIKSGAVKKVTENAALLNGSILAISGKGNDVWIGGFDGAKLCTLKTTASGAKEINFITNAATDSLRKSYVYCIYTDEQNNTWFGTDGEGAYVFDGKHLKNLSSAGLNAGTIYSILGDGSGNTWFNSQDNGIYKFNGKRFQNYSLNEGLSDVSISSMIFDKTGDLFLAHKNGVDILNRKEIRFTYLKNNRLLTNMNPDLNAATMNGAGDIFIGTEKFVLQLSPGELSSQPFPKTFLESISIFQRETGDSIHSFSSEQNNFSFAFTGLWYSNPSLVQFQYKLEGLNEEWINTTDREINFPKLSAGQYIFTARSSLNNDFSNASEASFKFEITPPFWKTTWFQVIGSLTIALLLYLFIRWRDRRIRNIDRLKKEAIEFQFEMLKSQVNPHFLFNSFNTLITIIEEDQKTAVSYVEKLSEYFRSIVAYRDKNLIPLKEEIILLNNFFFLQKKRFGQYLNLDIKLDSPTINNAEIPPLTLQLLVENAIKHNAVSKESPIYIEVLKENENIIVRNNLNPKMLKERSSGMGIQNITNRFRMLTDKTIEVIDDGKFFTVKIPILVKP
ncbi:MAG: two-component regulator propeller domain-containing protein [Bacteroidota bacterium]